MVYSLVLMARPPRSNDASTPPVLCFLGASASEINFPNDRAWWDHKGKFTRSQDRAAC